MKSIICRKIQWIRMGALSALGALFFFALPIDVGGVRIVLAQETSVPTFFSTKINVSDLDRSVEFYTKIMGMKITARVGNDRITEVVLTRTGEGAATSEQALILYHDKHRAEPLVLGNAFNNLLFVFPDLTECLMHLDAAGYSIRGSREPRPAPPSFARAVTILYTNDPDGYTIELVQYFN